MWDVGLGVQSRGVKVEGVGSRVCTPLSVRLALDHLTWWGVKGSGIRVQSLGCRV